LLPLTDQGMDHVCYFRHALALDERRVKFIPEYACGGQSAPAEKQAPFKHGMIPRQKEVWFAGTHSDMLGLSLLASPRSANNMVAPFSGGGNVENPSLDRTRPPLRWMIFEASHLGLQFHPFTRDLV
jgi:hypothetical protein